MTNPELQAKKIRHLLANIKSLREERQSISPSDTPAVERWGRKFVQLIESIKADPDLANNNDMRRILTEGGMIDSYKYLIDENAFRRHLAENTAHRKLGPLSSRASMHIRTFVGAGLLSVLSLVGHFSYAAYGVDPADNQKKQNIINQGAKISFGFLALSALGGISTLRTIRRYNREMNKIINDELKNIDNAPQY